MYVSLPLYEHGTIKSLRPTIVERSSDGASVSSAKTVTEQNSEAENITELVMYELNNLLDRGKARTRAKAWSELSIVCLARCRVCA